MNYRFLFLGRLGSPTDEQQLQAADDSEALELAGILAHPFGIEIRQAGRRVGMVLPGGKTISPASINF